MKTKNIFVSVRALTVFILSLFFINCSNNESLNDQDLLNDELLINTNIGSLHNIYDASGEDIYTFSNGEIISAYIISSDEDGNFENEIVIQESTFSSDYGAKILIKIQDKDLYELYEPGRKIIINMNGLSMKKINQGYVIGVRKNIYNSELNHIQDEELNKYIKKTGYITDILDMTPTIISIEELNSWQINGTLDWQLNTLIQIDNVQFTDADLINNYSGPRPLINCENPHLQTILKTSHDSSFASLPITSNSGSLTGILQRDENQERFIIKINNLNYLSFFNDRCNKR